MRERSDLELGNSLDGGECACTLNRSAGSLRSALFAVTLCAALAVWPSSGLADPAEAAAGSSRAWLGVWLTDAVDGGVEVVALVPGGPVHKAGLQVGDVILEADGRQLADQAELSRVLGDSRPGDRLGLVLLRGGASVQTEVELSQRRARFQVRPPRVVVPTAVPPNPPVAPSLYRLESNLPDRLLGLQVAHVTADLRRHYGAPSEVGVLVTRSEPDKPADLAGVRVGDVLTRLGELEIREPEQLERSLLRWNWKLPLELTVVRDGEPRVLTLSSPAAVTRPGAEAPEPDSAGIERSERELLESKLRMEIELLERRIEQLRRDLERLREKP